MPFLSDYGLNVHGHRITDQWVFGRGLSEELLLTLYINVSKNNILLCEILCSNLIVLCLLFLKIQVVLAQFLSTSKIYHRHIVSIDLFLMLGYILFFKLCHGNICVCWGTDCTYCASRHDM